MTRPVSERLRMLDEAMTPGPWRVKRSHAAIYPPTAHGPILSLWGTTPDGEKQMYGPNRDGIAALRNALPALVALVEAAERFEAAYPGNSAGVLGNGAARWALDEHRAALSALSTALPDVEVEA